MIIRTATDLKREHQRRFPDSPFFSRDSMRHFGDTIANYGVNAVSFTIIVNGDEVQKNGFELYRKSPVKNGRTRSAYFLETMECQHWVTNCTSRINRDVDIK